MSHEFRSPLTSLRLLVVLPLIGQGDDPEVLFKAARKKEAVDGDLNSAIAIYQEVLEKAGRRQSFTGGVRPRAGFGPFELVVRLACDFGRPNRPGYTFGQS